MEYELREGDFMLSYVHRPWQTFLNVVRSHRDINEAM